MISAVQLKGHTGPLYVLCAGAQSGRFFSAGSDGFVVEWDCATMAQAGKVIRVGEAVYSLHFDRENEILLIGTSGGKIHVVDFRTSKELRCLEVHSKGIFGFYKLDEGRKFMALGGDGQTSLWSYPDFELLNSHQWHGGKCRELVAISSSLYAMATSSGELIVIDPLLSIIQKRFEAHSSGMTSLAIHPKKPILLTGGRDAHMNSWNIENDFEKILSMPLHNYAIYDMSFDPSTTILATASRDKTIKLWDASSMELIQKLDFHAGGHTRSVNDLLWISEKLFVSCGDEGVIVVWSLK